MKAIKIIEPGKAALVPNEPIPPLPSPDWMLVKTAAVALNPTDWKHIDGQCKTRSTVGCDFAGVVEEVGSDVTRPFKKGDRVWGALHGSCVLHLDRGAFQEYVIVRGDSVLRIPDGVSFEAAASAGVGMATVGQGLYQEMGLPWPEHQFEEGAKKTILIYGGSSATGAIGIQFAKLSGFEVITTCSTANFDYVKSLGADVVFDSRDPDIGTKIREYTNNKLYYAWDCIGEHGSPAQCCNALASSAPENQKIHYGTISYGVPPTRDDVVFTHSIGYTATGIEWEINVNGQDMRFPAQPDHLEFMKKWVVVAEKLFLEGKWKPHRQEVREGGLEGILSGLEDMKAGKVNGVKLVYTIH